MNVQLSSGPLPVALLVLGALALAWLCIGGTRYRRVVLPVALAAAAVGTVLFFVLAELVLHWWDASFPRYLYLYAAAGIFALAVLVPRFRSTRRRTGRALTVLASVLVLISAASGANTAYDQYPTLAELLNPPPPTSGNPPHRNPADVAGLPPTTAANWQPPADLPARGRVYTTDLPESGSGYSSGPGLVWLPPAYLASTPAVDLPVLVLLHGQPGSPSDWTVSGQLAEVMDGFAARNRGLAPVVVMPDLSGTGGTDWPLCLDSKVGRSATYLATDLPAWVRDNLVSGLAGGRQWAVAGYSYGGTCALQLAVNFPDSYPTFVDISGENAPTDPAGRQALIDTYFGGDQAAFEQQNPLDRLKRDTFTDSAGIVVVGEDDGIYAPQGRQVYQAAQAAGMDVHLQELPGGHSWQVWRAGLSENLQWLSVRLGLLPQ